MTNAFRITVLSLTASAVLGCSAKKASGAQADASDPSQAASTSTQGADASWSATIDGEAVTGKGVDQALQQQNAGYVLPRQGPGNKFGMFTLYSKKDAEDDKANISLTFRFPPHTGTYVHAGTYQSCTCDLILNKNITIGDLARYNADTVTITITSMSTTRIAGTFSGNFKLSDDTPRAAQKRATVTNGKFDIPMSTSNITPE
ncbi:MAG TPA: hypothetical protein VIC24_12610 [Gemmatimonadaceae bacterium]|jgi:hypothetical protein